MRRIINRLTSLVWVMMVSEVIVSRLKVSIGKTVDIFQKSTGWKYTGKILACDDEFLIILDFKKNYEKYIELSDLREANVYNG